MHELVTRLSDGMDRVAESRGVRDTPRVDGSDDGHSRGAQEPVSRLVEGMEFSPRREENVRDISSIGNRDHVPRSKLLFRVLVGCTLLVLTFSSGFSSGSSAASTADPREAILNGGPAEKEHALKEIFDRVESDIKAVSSVPTGSDEAIELYSLNALRRFALWSHDGLRSAPESEHRDSRIRELKEAIAR